MKIGIISLGLIGGSLFKTLIKQGFNVHAVTRNETTINSVKKQTNNISKDLLSLSNCDVIFVCSPMNKTSIILDELETIVSPNTIVADVCSLKKFINNKQRPYIFIGTHPMAGTENSGFEASVEGLFNQAKWVITPFNKTPKEAIENLKTIIKATGAIPIETTPEEHDVAVALISHMPLILSQALMETAGDNDLALKLAASGFRDMTRLSLSNTEMANDMLTLNTENIKESLISLKNNIDKILESDYKQTAEIIKNKRQKLYNSDGKNIYN